MNRVRAWLRFGSTVALLWMFAGLLVASTLALAVSLHNQERFGPDFIRGSAIATLALWCAGPFYLAWHLGHFPRRVPA